MILEVKKISKNYGKLKVLKNIDYKFRNKTFYCISGKSGAGKSTLIQILGLLKSPSSGSVFINNLDTSRLNDDEKSEIRNQEIGFVFQSFYLDNLLKAYENVMLPMYVNDKDKTLMKKRAMELLDLVGLSDRYNHFPKELSGGEQQRVAIARALANNPQIILADEPTGSLDSDNEQNILQILKKLASDGKCIIIVSHSKEVQKYADKVLVIENNNLIEVKHEK